MPFPFPAETEVRPPWQILKEMIENVIISREASRDHKDTLWKVFLGTKDAR